MKTTDYSFGSREASAAAWLYISAALSLVVIEAVVVSRFPAYSYITNYVSDLGVPEIGSFEGRAINSPLAWLMNTGFVLHGFLVLTATALLVRAVGSGRVRWMVLSFAVTYAIGFAVIAIIHGSEQSEAAGIVGLHFLGGGLLAFAGSGMAITAGIGSRRFGVPTVLRTISVALGVASLTLLALLAVDKADASLDILGEGALERGALYSILVWQALCGGAILRSRARNYSDSRAAGDRG